MGWWKKSVDEGEKEQTRDAPETSDMDEAKIGVEAPLYKRPVLSTLQSVLITICLTLAMTLNVLSIQSTIVALPSMGETLNIDNNQLQWIISSYALTFAGTLLLAGRLSDLYGHKILFLVGTSWYGVWCIACGFAPKEVALDVFRALQGLGMAAAIPAAMGVIAHSFPPGPAKSTAFASFSAGAPLGGSLGNLFGGVLTSYAAVKWRAIFFVSAGLAAFISVSAIFILPSDDKMNKHGNSDRSIDWIGAVLVTTGLVLLTFSLADAQSLPKGWSTPYIPALLVVSIVLLVAFGGWEYILENRLGRTPLMRMGLFLKERFTFAQVLACLGWACFASQQYFATLYYQEYRSLTPIETTLRFLPMALTGLVLNFIVAVVAAKAPAQLMFVLGAIGSSMAPLLFAIIPANGAFYWHYEFPAMVLTVFGADFTFATGIMYVSRVAARDEQALAGGFFNTSTQIGTSLGLAILTIVQSRFAKRKASALGVTYSAVDSDPAVLLAGLRAAFWGCFAFGIASLAIAVFCLYNIGTVGEKPEEPTPILAAIPETIPSAIPPTLVDTTSLEEVRSGSRSFEQIAELSRG